MEKSTLVIALDSKMEVLNGLKIYQELKDQQAKVSRLQSSKDVLSLVNHQDARALIQTELNKELEKLRGLQETSYVFLRMIK